eukprot:6213954-Alexandrium_andersonii.AAC.1
MKNLSGKNDTGRSARARPCRPASPSPQPRGSCLARDALCHCPGAQRVNLHGDGGVAELLPDA